MKHELIFLALNPQIASSLPKLRGKCRDHPVIVEHYEFFSENLNAGGLDLKLRSVCENHNASGTEAIVGLFKADNPTPNNRIFLTR